MKQNHANLTAVYKCTRCFATTKFSEAWGCISANKAGWRDIVFKHKDRENMYYGGLCPRCAEKVGFYSKLYEDDEEL